MKVVEILGSPRTKGPSTRIANSFVAKATESGAEIKSYTLNNMNMRGCQSCYACKTNGGECVLEDDLTEALADVRNADVVVMATPVYFWDVSAQFKLFFDRSYYLLKPDFMTNPRPGRLAEGKTAVLVITQGAGEDQHKEVVTSYSLFLSAFGFDKIEVIRASDTGLEVDVDVDKHIAQAQELASSLIN